VHKSVFYVSVTKAHTSFMCK